ncbi:MAG: adenylate kinase [Euryarchaeota archaeon]|nr:adenylate kinase [Euryarchaeota archaeon]
MSTSKNLVAVVSGVPGVGSSHVCSGARRELGEKYVLVSVGDVMLEEAATQGLATSRDELAALPIREHKLLQRRAGEEISRRGREHSLIVDSRFVVRTPQGFLPGFSATSLSDVRPDLLVSIEAEPETVIERRDETPYREYPDQPSTIVAFHQQLNRAAAVTYATQTGATIMPISNEGEVDEAVRSLVSVIERAASR